MEHHGAKLFGTPSTIDQAQRQSAEAELELSLDILTSGLLACLS